MLRVLGIAVVLATITSQIAQSDVTRGASIIVLAVWALGEVLHSDIKNGQGKT